MIKTTLTIAAAVLFGLLSILVHDLMYRSEMLHEQYVISAAKKEQFHAHKVSPDLNLYLGSYPSSLQYDYLKERNVTNIVSIILAVAAPPKTPKFRDTFDYLVVKGLDRPSQVLISHFEDVHAFIDEGLKNGGVLVHCMAGVSRSATIVISYLMSRQNMTLAAAKQQVKSARNIIYPNEGFIKQLKHYESHLNTKRSAKVGEVLTPPLSAYAAEEKYGWNFFTTMVLHCEKQKECSYVIGNYFLDKIQDVVVYCFAQLERINEKVHAWLKRKL